MKIFTVATAISMLAVGVMASTTADAKRNKHRYSATCTGVTQPSGHRKCVMGFRVSGGHRNAYAHEPYVYRRFYGNYPEFDNSTFYDRVFPHD